MANTVQQIVSKWVWAMKLVNAAAIRHPHEPDRTMAFGSPEIPLFRALAAAIPPPYIPHEAVIVISTTHILWDEGWVPKWAVPSDIAIRED